MAEQTDRTETHTMRACLEEGIRRLASAGIAEAETDARLLLETATNTDRSYYYLHRHQALDASDAELYWYFISRRMEREPLQYITGEAPFFGEMFYVTPDVLIPRADTEKLVEEAGKRMEAGMRVLDLCTGSGCVLLSILKRYSVTGIGVDLSPAALAVAEQNRRRLRLRATWIESDLFARVGGTFDRIVCNPPYVESAVIRQLEPEVKDHEPLLALDGGEDGLFLIRKIIAEAPLYLRPDGWLLMEIGAAQGEAVVSLFEQNGFCETEVIRDLEERDRVVIGKKRNGI